MVVTAANIEVDGSGVQNMRVIEERGLYCFRFLLTLSALCVLESEAPVRITLCNCSLLFVRASP